MKRRGKEGRTLQFLSSTVKKQLNFRLIVWQLCHLRTRLTVLCIAVFENDSRHFPRRDVAIPDLFRNALGGNRFFLFSQGKNYTLILVTDGDLERC